MKKIIPKDLSERMNISCWAFYEPLQVTQLNETDIADHESQVDAVYNGLLHEASVVDECRWRFERTFKSMDYYMI